MIPFKANLVNKRNYEPYFIDAFFYVTEAIENVIFLEFVPKDSIYFRCP